MNPIFHTILAAPTLYLDPGSSSFLIQMLLAALLGAGLTIRLFWGKIKALFSRKPAAEDPVDDQQDEE